MRTPKARDRFLPLPASARNDNDRDHRRERQLELGPLQREVAERLGVDSSITNCELSRTRPALG